MASNAQFGRSASLVLAKLPPVVEETPFNPLQTLLNPQQQGIDLSELRFTFDVKNADTESPNTAIIRVYNLKQDTQKSIINEYDSVVLQAGYQNNIGIIFRGSIKQFVVGKEANIDNFLEIRAADGDLGYNFGFVNTTLAAGSTPQQQLDTASAAMGLPLDPNASSIFTGGVRLQRGKVMFGLSRVYARDLANTHSARFSIQDNQIVMVPLTGYLPGQAVQINSSTGMIGVPEATENGIQVTTLLNPLIKIGTQIQINNSDITQQVIVEQFGFPSFTSVGPFIADVTRDGFYRVLVAEHSGDIRGHDWYTKIVALSLDKTAQPTNAVKAYG